MHTFDTIAALRACLDEHRRAGRRLGFVPTMGYLHAGHLSLIQAAHDDCDVVVLSIFVNPRQFGPQEDFSRYPRDMARDLRLAQEAGVHVVFTPTVEEMYPAGYATEVVVHGLTEPLCGASRPGHFTGVTTVVAKLFHIVGPERTYFGQKDYQQAVVIRKMATDLCMPLQVVTCPTVRETDGLALSSRNVYLSPAERQAALVIPGALQLAAARLAQGERDGRQLARALWAHLAAEPLVRIEYVTVCDPHTLQEVVQLPAQVLVAIAVHVGKTRLIDNALLTCPQTT